MDFEVSARMYSNSPHCLAWKLPSTLNLAILDLYVPSSIFRMDKSDSTLEAFFGLGLAIFQLRMSYHSLKHEISGRGLQSCEGETRNMPKSKILSQKHELSELAEGASTCWLQKCSSMHRCKYDGSSCIFVA